MIRTALIGINGIGAKHGGWMQGTGRMQVCATCDVNPELRGKSAEMYPDAAFYTSVAEMLGARDDIDLVAIATPHNLHAPLAIAALNAGVNVVVEKPMATAFTDTQAMIEAAETSGRFITVFHNRRLDPWFLGARSVLETGALGTVFKINVCHSGFRKPTTWRGNKKANGGVAFDWGSHLVDYAQHFDQSGVEAVSGWFCRLPGTPDEDIEDHGEIRIHFASGAIANITVSYTAYAPPYRYRICGSKGTLIDEWGGENKLTLYTQLARGEQVTARIDYPQSGAHVAYYENVADHIEDGAPLLVPPQSAARVIDVLCTAERSWHAGGQPLPLEG